MNRLGTRKDQKGRRNLARYLTSVLLTVITLLCALKAADAGSASATLGVSVRVVRNCSISAGSLDFGDYGSRLSQATTESTARTSLAIECARGSNQAVSIGLGNRSSNSFTTRLMSSGGGRVSYEIYRNSALTQLWNDSPAGPVSLHAITSTQPIIIPVHARISAGHPVQPEKHVDYLVVIVNF